MAWHVDKGLAALIAQWKKEHPGAVVGTIGDTSHQAGKSDHNPEADGSVDAGDFMPGKGVSMDDLRDLAADLVKFRDKRFLYCIIDQRICSSVVDPWNWRPYKGDRHTHLHVSVNDRFETDGSAWKLDQMARTLTFRPVSGMLPELRVGDEDIDGKTAYIGRAQRLLGVGADGVYGPRTAVALAKRMAGQKAYKPSSTNGGKLYENEWRVLYGLWK